MNSEGDKFAKDLEEAVVAVASRLVAQSPDPQPASHRSFQVRGLEDPECTLAVGLYLVGLVIQMVREDLMILAHGAPSDEEAWEAVTANVEKLVGGGDTISDEFRSTRRDPWLMEAIARLLAHASRTIDVGWLADIVVGTRVTFSVTRSGLDFVGLSREGGNLRYWVAEVKATEDNLSGNLSECYGTLRDVRHGRRSMELRYHLQSLGIFLDEHDRRALGPLLYRADPVLIPLVGHGADDAFDPTRLREAVRSSIGVPPGDLRFVVCSLENYRSFFDRVAEAMRRHVAERRP